MLYHPPATRDLPADLQRLAAQGVGRMSFGELEALERWFAPGVPSDSFAGILSEFLACVQQPDARVQGLPYKLSGIGSGSLVVPGDVPSRVPMERRVELFRQHVVMDVGTPERHCRVTLAMHDAVLGQPYFGHGEMGQWLKDVYLLTTSGPLSVRGMLRGRDTSRRHSEWWVGYCRRSGARGEPDSLLRGFPGEQPFAHGLREWQVAERVNWEQGLRGMRFPADDAAVERPRRIRRITVEPAAQTLPPRLFTRADLGAFMEQWDAENPEADQASTA